MKAMHLLFLTPGFPENEEDTRCIPAMQLFMDALVRKYTLKATVIAFHYPYQKRTYSWKGIQVHALGGKNKKYLKRWQLLRKATHLLEEIHAKDAIDQIHSFWFGEHSKIGERFSQKNGIKCSCTLMGQDVLKANKWMQRIKNKPLLVSLSHFQEQHLQAAWNIKSDFSIPWGIQKQDTLSGISKTYDVVGVGWFNAVKNYTSFIRIVSKLKESFPNLRMLLVGQGELMEQLTCEIKEANLSNHLQVVEELTREQTLLKIAQSKCLLHTSTFESFGMVLVEALQQGTQVFSTAVGIAPELEQASIFRSEEEAIQQLTEFLSKDESITSFSPFLVQDTVQEYMKKIFS